MVRNMAWIVTVVVLAVAPLFLPDFRLYQICLIAATAIIVLGVMVATGLSGQITLAQAAFAAIGAYGTTLLAHATGAPILVALPVAVVLSATAGYLLGLITLSISGHYLALATLAVTGIVQVILIEAEWLTGGAEGLAAPRFVIFGKTLSTGGDYYAVIIPISLLSVLLVQFIIRSRFGRALSALRQSEIAANTLGVDVLRYRAAAFALSAAFGALGGGLLAPLAGYLDPTQYGVIQSVNFIAYAIVGGLGSPIGPFLGTALFTFLPEIFSGFRHYAGVVVAAVLLATLLFRPNGVSSILLWKRRQD